MPGYACPDCLTVVEHANVESCPTCGYVRQERGWKADPLTGLILGGRYRLEGRLGSGGMASVFRATRVGPLGGHVAVKVLAPRFARTVVARRFEREAQVVSRLTNPYIVRIYDFDQFELEGEETPLYYIAMELVRGDTLEDVLDKQGRVNFLWGLDVLRQAARGLDEAHQAGIVHRDLKPANIMLVRQREATHVKLLDFGIAALTEQAGKGAEKLTQAGFVSGTPDYMAPEQAVASPTMGPPVDIYALGLIAFELFSGKRPFVGDTALDTLMKRVTSEPPRLADACPAEGFPPALHQIVDRMLRREPAERYQNAGELLDALARFPTLQTSPDFVTPRELVERYRDVNGIGRLSTAPGLGGGAAQKPLDTVTMGVGETRAELGQAAETAVAQTAPVGMGDEETREAHPALSANEATVTATAAVFPVRKSKAWLWLLIAILVIGGGTATAIVLTQGGSGPDAPPVATAPTRGDATVAAETGAPPTSPPRPDTTAPAAAVSKHLPGARAPLAAGFDAHTLVDGALTLTVGVTAPLPPLHKPVEWRVAARDREGPLRVVGVSGAVSIAATGEAFGRLAGKPSRNGDRGIAALPALPMSTTFAVDLKLKYPDGSTSAHAVTYDASTGAVRLRR